MELFVYGTLMVPEVMRAVSGFSQPGLTAELWGYRCRLVKGEVYPAILPDPGESVSGLLYRGVSAAQLMRLDDFEGDLYRRMQVQVWSSDASYESETYVLDSRFASSLSQHRWSLQDFRHNGLKTFIEGYPGFDAISVIEEVRDDR